MKIIFLGSSDFALPSLYLLAASGQELACVVTQPDRPKGRGRQVSVTPVKSAALAKGIEVYQPRDINDRGSVKFLKSLKPDFLVVVAYGQILSQEVLEVPAQFVLNLHASLLPKYRGAAPINWAIINGENQTGLTVMKVIKKMDAGPVISCRKEKIAPEDDLISVESRLSRLGAELLVSSLKKIQDNDYQAIPQDDSHASYAPKLKKDDGRINWKMPAQSILNLIRGCANWPGAFTYYHGRLLKIYRAEVCLDFGAQAVPGKIIQARGSGIAVSTAKGVLVIKELQLEGRRRMSAAEFVAGHKICAGESVD